MSQYPGGPQQQQYPYPGGPQGGGGAAAAVPDNYFTESRKGEINELRQLLRSFATERDPQKKRDSIKKVIAYMTLGINVSRLFSEMMMAIETRDLVIKKMVYLYLTNYARTHPELAQMCTNTLQKDCCNEDPMVRGLALRALCSLNLPSMVEYISEPLRRSLSDGHAYVRKTGVMGVLKLYHLDPSSFEESGFVDILYDMLRDPDASVVVNCVVVLNEVMSKSKAGGMAINRAIMLHLLNRIHEFNEFAKVQILELVPRYIPANDDEGFQIMNLLDPVLSTSGSAAVMATIRAFLSIAEQVGGDDNDAMKRQIVERVKAPLVTQISSGSSEMMYSLLKHVEAMTVLCPGIFDDEYRQFYVRYNEPTYVKYLKIMILPKLANSDTAPDIVSELAECVFDPNVRMSRLSVRSMASIACSGQGGPGAAEAIARRLVEMLDLNVEHISSEAASALTLVVRKHPGTIKNLVAPPLARTLRYMKESNGKAAVIHMIGECGDIVSEAPYVLEKLIDNYKEIDDVNVKMALLSSTVRLFFVRPPEVQKMLGRLLKFATEDVTSQDLHDRALYYYRMLKSGSASVLENVVRTDTFVPEGIKFAEEQDDVLRAELMKEFNTLSIVYGKPSTNFIAPEFQVKYIRMPEEHPLQPGAPPVTPAEAAATNAVPSMASAPPATAPAPPQEMDLLGFGGPATPAPAPVSSSASVALDGSRTMTGDEYQNIWAEIQDSQAIVSMIPMRLLPTSTDDIEKTLGAYHVMTMASGELPNEFKFFLYAHVVGSTVRFLIQANIEKTAEPIMIVTVKVSNVPPGSEPNTLVEQLTAIMTKALN